MASEGMGKRGTDSFKYFTQPLSSFWFLVSDLFIWSIFRVFIESLTILVSFYVLIF